MSKSSALYGYYSFQVARESGYGKYRTPNGQEVPVTESSEGEPRFKHDDLVYLGLITEFIERVPPFDPRLAGQSNQ
jgi:hypothetical protein